MQVESTGTKWRRLLFNVGAAYLAIFQRKLDGCIILNHTGCSSYQTPSPFPGGCCASLALAVHAMGSFQTQMYKHFEIISRKI